MKLVNCTICESNNIKVKFQVDNIIYYMCINCKSIFVDNYFKSIDVYSNYNEEYYENSSTSILTGKKGYTSYAAARDTLHKGFVSKFKVVQKYKKRGVLLDAGAAYGYFLQMASASFSCIGLEVSSYAAEIARQAQKVDVRIGSLESTDFSDSSFDVVTMWDIVEHLMEPRQALKEVCRILKPGGYLFISTDDASNWLPRLLGKHWWALAAPYHLYHFSKKGLSLMTTSQGFEEPIFLADKRSYTLPEVAHHFSVAYGSLFLQRIGTALGKTILGKYSIHVTRPEQFIAVIRKPAREDV